MGAEREFEHISFEGGNGRRSKEVEVYNFHKAASVLAEYRFDWLWLKTPATGGVLSRAADFRAGTTSFESREAGGGVIRAERIASSRWPQCASDAPGAGVVSPGPELYAERHPCR